MKRVIAICLTLMLVFSLCACGQSDTHVTENATQEVVEKADGEELATARAEAEAYNELLASAAAAASALLILAGHYDHYYNYCGNGNGSAKAPFPAASR